MRKSPVHRTLVVLVVGLALAAGSLLAASHTAKQTPPIQFGTSGGSANDISRRFCCGGTLGSLITRDGTQYILSNNHILARSGSAVVGENDIQPGLVDSACSATGDNIVGTFPGNFVPLGTANVDVGLSLAAPSMVDQTGSILDIGVPCSATRTPVIGMNVEKSGRTTAFTTGTIQATNVNVSIQYQTGCNAGRKFTETYTNQVSITPGTFSAGGDSGSLILSNDSSSHYPVALLYAGSSSVTIGNPIQDVVNALNAGGHSTSFVGNATCSGPATAVPLSGITGSQNPHGPSDSDVDFARRVKESHEPELSARPEVLGAGVGAAEHNPTEAVIALYVNSGKGMQSHGLPTELDGVKVRVIPTDPFVAF
jgi:hypothetical protein